jgi:hypothetical protein
MKSKKDLLDLKDQIEEAKAEVNKKKGNLDYLMKSLKEQWKCKTIAEAEKTIKEFDKQIENLQEQIDTGISELEEKYEFTNS